MVCTPFVWLWLSRVDEIAGAIFADMEPFPGPGAFHGSERRFSLPPSLLDLLICYLVVREAFGTFNRSTASPGERAFSMSFQTALGNFIKNPNASPVPHWPKYSPGNVSKTLAKLGYIVGNDAISDFVQVVPSETIVRNPLKPEGFC